MYHGHLGSYMNCHASLFAFGQFYIVSQISFIQHFLCSPLFVMGAYRFTQPCRLYVHPSVRTYKKLVCATPPTFKKGL